MPPPALPLAALLAALLAAASAGAAHPERGGASCVAPGCHPGIAEAPAGGSTHEPAAGEECTACHDAALAWGWALLPPGVAEPGGDVALCGGCHPEHAASGSEPSARTAFAEGGRDLHGVHVRVAGRGRVCLGCHEPHAGRQRRLLREEIPARGGVRITQRFEERPGGGRCTTRCHAPRAYRR